MDNAEISKLTKDAEAGKGCSTKEVISGLSFEDSLKTLQAIEIRNSINRDSDSSLPKEFFDVHADKTGARAVLKKKDWTFGFPSEMLSDTLSWGKQDFAARSQTCSDDK